MARQYGDSRSITSIATVGIVLAILLFIMLGIGWYWSREPVQFDVRELALQEAEARGEQVVTGYVTTATLIEVIETLLNKNGGFLSNDIMPPSIFLDNIPNWEYGVMIQARDLIKSMRNDFSRSQTQSTEDPSLRSAEPKLNFEVDSWWLPSTESEYEQGIERLQNYLSRLADTRQQNAQFYARADNLRDYLRIMETRLGSISQRLTASVGQDRLNTDLDTDAQPSTPQAEHTDVKTPWLEIDNVFFEARGATWAMVHFLKAIEIDFADVLAKKNATVSLRQIIRELEATQAELHSPIVLNGEGLGLLANHSLTIATYIARANAAMNDLSTLLAQG